MRGRRASDGFTLVELLVVLAIGTIMTALALSSMSNFLQQSRVNSAARMVLTMINRARTTAVSQGRPIGIYFGKATSVTNPIAHPITFTNGTFPTALYMFADNQINPTSWATSSALNFTPGSFGDDDFNQNNSANQTSGGAALIDGPRILPLVGNGTQQQQIVLVPSTSLSALPDDGSGGFSIIFNSTGQPMLTNILGAATVVNGMFPLTIGVVDSANLAISSSAPPGARYIVIQASGTAQIQ